LADEKDELKVRESQLASLLLPIGSGIFGILLRQP
jgi:hypothetical protein